jgi:ZipA, C-terminal FtsZ-binding domain
MTELQMGLIVFGGIVIAGVYGYNVMQERRARKSAEKMFDGGHRDALLDANSLLHAKPAGMDDRVEPSFGDTAIDDSDFSVRPGPKYDFSPEAPVIREPAAVPLTTGSVSDPVSAVSSAALGAPKTMQLLNLGVDDKIDLVAVIMANHPVAPDVLKEAMAKSRNFGKPVVWEGLQNGNWNPVQTDVPRYKEIKTGLQLADRKGALDELFVGQFVQLAQQFAERAGGVCQVEAPGGAVERAKELDAFAVSVDVEIGVNVISRSGAAFQGTKVRALAEAAGMKLDPHSGVFQHTNERGETQFVLANLEPRAFTPEQIKNLTTHGLTILLDVPRVGDGTKVFQQMMALSRALADGLGGEVVDDARKPLTNTGADAIRLQLAEIYRRMSERGIAAGSSSAQRLFS